MIRCSPEVSAALERGQPVVALESTVLAHGLPHPANREMAHALEDAIRGGDAIPATVAVLDGVVRLGLGPAEIERICSGGEILKLSTRDLPIAVARGLDGATTVAATMFISSQAGIRVFATGGIGGVHRGELRDVSADLTELQRTRQIVVCAGAKAILDLPGTREALETRGVLLVGWGTDEMPAFYSSRSGQPVDVRADDEEQVAALWRAQGQLKAPGAVLVCVPPPAEAALESDVVERHIASALEVAKRAGIVGKALTPFLLTELARLSNGATLETNMALLRNNAAVAARVARALVER